MPPRTRKQTTWNATPGRVLGSGAEVPPVIQDNEDYVPGANEADTDDIDEGGATDDASDVDTKDLLQPVGTEDAKVEEEDEPEEEDEEADEADEAEVGGTTVVKDDGPAADKKEVRVISQAQMPGYGDSEVRMKDGSYVFTKGGGVKLETDIVASMKTDPRYLNIQAKSKLTRNAIIKRATENMRGKPTQHHFTDTGNKAFKAGDYSTDFWEECLIGPFVNKKVVEFDGEPDEDMKMYILQGYHQYCHCTSCTKRRSNDDLEKGRVAAKLRLERDRARIHQESVDKKTRRLMRKTPKTLRSGKVANEGCSLSEDWDA